MSDLLPVSAPKFNSLPLVMGGAALSGEGGGYGFGTIEEAEIQKLLELCVASGIIYFDTAPIYGFGQSEKTLGKYLKLEREKNFIISKSGVSWHDTKRINMTNDPIIAIKMLEQTLRDLQTDYIDLYMIHWPDEKIDIRKPYEALIRQMESGKIRHLGLCNTTLEDFNKCSELLTPQCLQSEYNMFQSSSFDGFPSEILKMGWGTFDKGILSGSVKKGRKYEKSDCRSWAPWWKEKLVEEKLDRVNNVEKAIAESEFTLRDIALKFCINPEQNIYPIVGVKSCEQLQEVLDTIAKKIPVNLIHEAHRVLHEKK